MPAYELLAIMPRTHALAPNGELQFVTHSRFTAVFTTAVKPIIQLPNSRKTALMNAAKRQGMLEACMHLGPLLVVRPQFYVPLCEMRSLITANAPLLNDLLQRFTGHDQYQVVIQWDPSGVMKRYQDSPELIPLFAQGAVSESSLKAALEKLAKRLGQSFSAQLDAVSRETVALPLDENILTNTVLLLPHSCVVKLDNIIQKIDEEWSDGLLIKQIGPAPAATFALLDPIHITCENIKSAQTLLNIDEHTTIDAARRTALRNAPQAAAAIRRAASVLAAASRIDDSSAGFYLCDTISEGKAIAATISDAA